ncbi:MAG: T9SS type A sorting domain-containing protein, partial [Bacteroidota bacterium]
DSGLDGSGYVVATDVAGNSDSLLVELDAPAVPDTALPVLAGTLTDQTFSGTATDSTAIDTGLATVALDAASTNLSLAVDPFTAGDPLAAFTATPIDGALAASGYVIATDVAGNADSLLVEIEAAVVPDTSAPVLAGMLTDQTFSGTTTDDTATDTGIATVALGTSTTNLALAVDPFTPGDATVSFTATPIDAAVSASGYVVATDVAGNADSLFVEIELLSSGMPFDLTYAIAYAFDTETSGTITVSAVNIGTEDMNRVRVKLTATQDVSVSPGRINLGAVPAGSSKDAVFTFSDAGPDASARFRVQDLDVRIADEDNPDNNIGEVVLVPIADQAPPVLSGGYAAESFDGSASDSATDDTGIATIALDGAATNLTLVVDPFTAGASSVGFMAMPTDPTLDASGYIVATDVQGNADSLFVEFDAPDTLAPALTGAYSRSRFDGTATDDDTGVATVTLRSDATNLALAVDPFTAGDATVSFAATPIDAAAGASGYVIATDVAGNADSLFVDIAPPPPDETRPVLTGTLADQAFSGVATDSTTIDTGLASVALSAGATNLDLAVDPFTEGDATVAFTATPTDGALAASGYVVATDVAGNTDSLFVDIAPPPPDENAPVLSGTADGSVFTGTATDQAPTDEGLASVVLDAAASNLTLVVDAFGPGAATVSFTVTLTDTGLSGSGYVVATDVAGNADSLLVQIDPVVDEDAPVLTGSYGRRDFSGTASDDRSGDTGLASVTLRDAVNMSISVASFTAGASSTTYTVTLLNNSEFGEGYVVATDVAGNESELFVSSAESGRRVTSDASATGDDPEDAAGRDASDGLGASPDDTGADHDLADGGSADRGLDAGRSGEPSASGPRGQDDTASLDAANDAGPAENTDPAADDERGTRADRAPDRKPADDESPAERLDASEADREDRTAASPEADRAAAKPDRTSGNDRGDVDDRAVEGTADASEAGISETNTSEADAPESTAPRTTDVPAAQATIPDAFEVDVYPNPGGVRRSMTLRLPEDMALSVTVTDVLGRRVFEQRATLAAGVHRLDLDLGALAAGTYVLDVTADSARRVVRLSVSR